MQEFHMIKYTNQGAGAKNYPRVYLASEADQRIAELEEGEDAHHQLYTEKLIQIEQLAIENLSLRGERSVLKGVRDALQAENATLKRGRVSDDDIESYIEYLEADARQYERWGKVERAKGFDQLATRHEALLAERKEQSDGHIEA